MFIFANVALEETKVDLVELGRHAALRRLFQKWSEGSIPSFDIKQERDHWRGQVAVNHPFLTLGVRLPLLALMPSKKIKTTVHELSIEEAAWLAGFFDGEGSIVTYIPSHLKHLGTKAYAILLPNTHLESLEKCKEITGAGNICVKYKGDERIKRQWTWNVHPRVDVISILNQILPYTITKKEKIKKILTEIDQDALVI